MPSYFINFGGVARWNTRQLRASGEVKTLEATMECARPLMAIDSQIVAMLEEKPSEVQLLTEQVALLTSK